MAHPYRPRPRPAQATDDDQRREQVLAMTNEKLLEEGRALRKKIDAAYEDLRERLSALGTLKREILSQESALRGIQDRLLSAAGVAKDSESTAATRRRLLVATDDDE